MQYMLQYLVIKGKGVDKLLRALLLPAVTFHDKLNTCHEYFIIL